MINTTKIYLVTNIDNSPNKVYIGKTSANNTRKYNHQKTFGKQIDYSYIDEIYSTKCEDWKWVETYWIQQFIEWGFEVVNSKKTGGSGMNFGYKQTPTQIEKRFKDLDWESIGKKISNSSKGVSRNKGNIQTPKVIENRVNKTDWERYGKIISKKKKGKPQLNLRKPIFQLDKNGNIIKEWSGQKQASVELNIDQASIWQVLNNKNKSAGGYIWQYKN
jgi:hypothetical protein